MNTQTPLAAGIAGALTLNLIHESARKLLPNAPHVDEIGMRAMQKYFLTPLALHPSKTQLRGLTLAGDMISNAAYYGLIAISTKDQKTVWRRAWVLGLAAGIGAVALPPKMGLGQQPSRNFPVTATLTVAWYLLGALAAAAVATKR